MAKPMSGGLVAVVSVSSIRVSTSEARWGKIICHLHEGKIKMKKRG